MRRYCFPVAVFALVIMSSCTNFLEEDARVSFGVDATELSFSTGGESHSVTISSGKKWDVTSKPDWVSLQSINPGSSPYEWIVSFSAEGNNEFGREGKIIIKAGTETADISVSQDGKKGKYIAVESVSLSPTELSLAEGDNAALTFAITPSNASVKDVSWESSSPTVATVSQSGRIDAIAEGTTVVTVTTKDGSKTATCTVTVHAPNNVIFYTSTSGSVIEPQAATSTTFGANLISNEYVNGRGVMTFDGDVTIIGYAAFSTRPDLESIHLPKTVVSIGGFAFDHCTSLTSIEFPNSLTNIGESAFGSCSSLVSLRIPASVTSIGDGAFGGTTKLTSISVDSGNPIYDSRDNCNAIIEKESNTLIRGCKNTVIPNSVTTIGTHAFGGSEISSIAIPGSVTRIEKNAFIGCDLASIVVDSGNWIYDSRNGCNAIIETNSNTLYLGCKNTVIPNSVTTIGENAFNSCFNLTSIQIPNSVTRIEASAFLLCGKLKAIEIPSSIKRIGDSAFSMCMGLTSIICYATTPPQIGSFVFSNGSTCPIYVPAQSLDAYKTDSGWKAYNSRLQAATGEHEYVEMGDGLKWATCNVGASFPWDYGDYYAWGETDTYYVGEPKNETIVFKNGKQSGYSWASYQFNPSGDGKTFSKYNGSDYSTLLREDDAAVVNWGGSWRMPTADEWLSLMSKCTCTWTYNYNGTGVRGRILTSNATGYEGNTLFLPAAGTITSTSYGDDGYLGCYWSSTSGSWLGWAGCVYLDSSDFYYTEQSPYIRRYWGGSIRPVSN